MHNFKKNIELTRPLYNISNQSKSVLFNQNLELKNNSKSQKNDRFKLSNNSNAFPKNFTNTLNDLNQSFNNRMNGNFYQNFQNKLLEKQS